MAAHAEEALQDDRVEIKTERGRIDAESSRRAAISAAMFAIGWPGGFVMLLIALVGMASSADPAWLLIGMLVASLIGSSVTLIGGYSIGWFAHYWFYETKTSPKRMATVIALIFDGVIVGWFLVMVFI